MCVVVGLIQSLMVAGFALLMFLLGRAIGILEQLEALYGREMRVTVGDTRRSDEAPRG